MKFNTILLRYGEIFLKGKNRHFFEKKLVSNIKKITAAKNVRNIRSRLVADYFADHKLLRYVFGLVSYSLAVRVDKDIEKVMEAAVDLLKDSGQTFKVETKRSDKSFPITSPDMNVKMGMYIEENSSLKFAFENPDTILSIEINQEGAYLFLESISCFGGLPTGVGGRVLLLMENETSVLAGLLAMKRGTHIFPTGNGDISLLQKFSPVPLKLVKLDDVDIEELAKEREIDVVVSGQTYEHFSEYDHELVVMRPLIGYDQKQVEKQLSYFAI